MITNNIGMLLLAIYLIAVGILTLTVLGIGMITGVLALLVGIFILIWRYALPDHASNFNICCASFGPMPLSSCLQWTNASFKFDSCWRANSAQRSMSLV